MSKHKNIHQKIASNIRGFRKDKGVSQEELALSAGLNRAYIGYIERGERRPSVDTLMSIAVALDLELHKLFIFTH